MPHNCGKLRRRQERRCRHEGLKLFWAPPPPILSMSTTCAFNAARRGAVPPGHDPGRSSPPTTGTRCLPRERASIAMAWSSCRPAGDKIPLDRPSPKSRKRDSAARPGKELAVHGGIDVHQLDGAGKLLTPLPHALDLDEPGVCVCFHDLPGKYVLGAVETGRRRDGVAPTGVRSTGRAHPEARQYKEPCKILHGTSGQQTERDYPSRRHPRRFSAQSYHRRQERARLSERAAFDLDVKER